MPNLPNNEPEVSMPTYSLTSDLTSFLRCARQYRMQKRGRLAPVNPVQMWAGHFIHGFMEVTLIHWQNEGSPMPVSKAFNQNEIPQIAHAVFQRLAREGLHPRGPNIAILAVERAFAMIERFGDALFPFITHSELKLQGIRQATLADFRGLDRYEILGIVDILASNQGRVHDGLGGNPLSQQLVDIASNQEVILDYKGMRRPPVDEGLWTYQEWQVNTYAWLRQREALDVDLPFGGLIYVNELVPTNDNLNMMIGEMQQGLTDVLPQSGSNDEQLLSNPRKLRTLFRNTVNTWRKEMEDWWINHWREQDWSEPMPRLEPNLPLFDLRMRRAIRIIDSSPEVRESSLEQFDDVATSIEFCLQKEINIETIDESWPTKEDAEPQDRDCTICSFKNYCPAMREHGLKPPSGPETV